LAWQIEHFQQAKCITDSGVILPAPALLLNFVGPSKTIQLYLFLQKVFQSSDDSSSPVSGGGIGPIILGSTRCDTGPAVAETLAEAEAEAEELAEEEEEDAPSPNPNPDNPNFNLCCTPVHRGRDGAEGLLSLIVVCQRPPRMEFKGQTMNSSKSARNSTKLTSS
jgi:hypothetical protein